MEEFIEITSDSTFQERALKECHLWKSQKRSLKYFSLLQICVTQDFLHKHSLIVISDRDPATDIKIQISTINLNLKEKELSPIIQLIFL